MTTNDVIFDGFISSISINQKDDTKIDINIYVGKDFDYSIFDASFATANKKYIPKWYSDRNGFVSLHTKYNVPVQDTTTDTPVATSVNKIAHSDDVLDLYHYHAAKVKVTLKDGAVYPKAIKILPETNEDDYNPFEGM